MWVFSGRKKACLGRIVWAVLLAVMSCAVSSQAEVAVVYSAHADAGRLSDEALRQLALERGSIEVWSRADDGTVKRDLVRLGDPYVGNPLFMTTQDQAMKDWANKGAKTDLMKDGGSMVSVPLAKDVEMVYQRPKSMTGPTFEVNIYQGQDVLVTEQWYQEVVNGVERPQFIRIDDGARVMVQVFEYTDTPPAPMPPQVIYKEGYDSIPEGMSPVNIPYNKADIQSQEAQFVVPQQGLDTLGFDSGWFPGGGTGDPGGFVIQLRVKAAAGYNYDASVNGLINLTPDNILGVGAAAGNWGFYFGAEFSLKAAADLSWVPLIGQWLKPFTINIPYVPEFNLVASDRDQFSNWLLDSVSTVRDEAGRTNITKLDIIALAISQGALPELPSWLPIKPTILVGLDIAAIANGTLSCDSVSMADGAAFTTEGQSRVVNVPPTGYHTIATYNEKASLDLGAKIYPYFTASIKVISWSWGYTYPSADDPNNFLNKIEWLPIKHRSFPFNDVEINFTGQPPTGDPTDWFTQHFNLSNNDLNAKRVRFTPTMSNNYYVACLEEGITAYRTPIAGATQLTVSRDQFVQVNLAEGKQVSLYGAKYSSFYVGGNGYITFNSGDTTHDVSLDNHFNQPRISALFYNLRLDNGGKVYFKQLPNRAVITYDNVVVTNVITPQTVSVQVEMFFDGRIVITWLKIDPTVFGLVGLSRGGGKPSDFVTSRFSRYGACLGAIADEAGVRVNFLPPEVLPLQPRWRLDNGEWLPTGAYASAPLGSHTVTFNTIPNLWQAPATMTVNLTQADAFTNLQPQWTRQKGSVRIYAQPETASWRLTGPDGVVQTGTGNTELTNQVTGTYTIAWQPLATYSLPTPPTQDLFLYPEASVIFNGVYPPIIGEGRADLTVNIEPAQAGIRGAQWQANGGEWQNSGVTLSVPDGDTTVTMKDLPGWIKPEDQSLFITRNTATTLTKTYVRQLATVIIDTDPNGAPWTLQDAEGVNHPGLGDATLADLPVGDTTVTWGAVPTYSAPAPNPLSFELLADETHRITGAYTPNLGEGEGILRITLLPDRAVNYGAQWRLLGGEWRSSGGMMAVADGEHTVKFKDLDGWVTPADQTVNVVRDIVNDVEATYVRRRGTVAVDVTPDNAPWTFVDADGETHMGAGDATLPLIPSGPLTMTWNELPGYSSPEPNPVNYVLEPDQTLTVQGAYIESILTVDFTATPAEGVAPLTVSFSDASHSTTKAIQEWRWYFGDGRSSTEQHPTHVYQSAGSFSVTLVVNTSEMSNMVTKKHFVTVDPGVPAAGPAGLALLALACAAAGIRRARRK